MKVGQSWNSPATPKHRYTLDGGVAFLLDFHLGREVCGPHAIIDTKETLFSIDKRLLQKLSEYAGTMTADC